MYYWKRERKCVILSVPTVSSVITDGVAIIHGLQDYEETERVASCI